jgi:hypothetical protein
VVFSCQRVGSQERSHSSGFSWISFSIHLGVVKWITISGKDFDWPRWIKRFLRICNYVKELLWFGNQNSLIALFKCASVSQPSLKSSSSRYQRQFNSSVPCPFVFILSMELLPTKLKLIQFHPSPLKCFMFVISIYVYEHSLHELTVRYSIFKKIHPFRVIPSFL